MSQLVADQKYSNTDTRLAAHEAMCEERSKTIFNRLDKIEAALDTLNKNIFVVALALISGMAGIIWVLVAGQ